MKKSVDMASVIYYFLQHGSTSPLVWQGHEGLIDEAQHSCREAGGLITLGGLCLGAAAAGHWA